MWHVWITQRLVDVSYSKILKILDAILQKYLNHRMTESAAREKINIFVLFLETPNVKFGVSQGSSLSFFFFRCCLCCLLVVLKY